MATANEPVEAVETVEEAIPVKPKAKPRAKAKPKAKATPKEVVEEVIPEEIVEAAIEVIKEETPAEAEETIVAEEVPVEAVIEPVIVPEVPAEVTPDFFFSEKNPNFITAIQKKFIKQLFQTRDYPASEVYAAFESLVSNLDNPEIRVYPDTIKQHYVTKREADVLISKLSSYPFRKKA